MGASTLQKANSLHCTCRLYDLHVNVYRTVCVYRARVVGVLNIEPNRTVCMSTASFGHSDKDLCCVLCASMCLFGSHK